MVWPRSGRWQPHGWLPRYACRIFTQFSFRRKPLLCDPIRSFHGGPSWNCWKVRGIHRNNKCSPKLRQDFPLRSGRLVRCRASHLLWWLCQLLGCRSIDATVNRRLHYLERKTGVHSWCDCGYATACLNTFVILSACLILSISSPNAAPIASIVPISSWIGFEIGLIQTELDAIVARHPDSVIGNTSSFSVFLISVKYRYYCIFMLMLIPLQIISGVCYCVLLVSLFVISVFSKCFFIHSLFPTCMTERFWTNAHRRASYQGLWTNWWWTWQICFIWWERVSKP